MTYLNPWIIDIEHQADATMLLNIINRETGEIKQIDLDVDLISAIAEIGEKRILKIAEHIEDDERETRLNETLGLEAPDA